MELSQPGDDVVAPKSGKRVEFRGRPDDPARDPLRFEMWLDADGHGPTEHVHPEQTEWLSVVGGRLGVSVAGDSRTLGPGERVTVPAGVRPRFWNAGDGKLHLEGGVDPGLRTEAFMRVTYGLARDGAPATPSGMPLNLLLLAVLLEEYDDMLYLARVPERLQRLGVRLLAPLGGLADYENGYPEYLG